MAARRKYPKRRFRRVLNPQPLPDHNVLVEFTRPDGSTYQRLMGGQAYWRLMRASKAGRTAQAKGVSHRWTSETARKAVKKLWATRWRKVKGVRIGVPAKRRAPIARQPLRDLYTYQTSNDICYDAREARWCRVSTGRWISEVTALRKLGHLPSHLPPIPTRVITRIKLIRGTPVAIPEPDNRVPDHKE